MPYKHINIEYGLPHKEYPKERIIEYVDALKNVLNMEREPIAITLLFTKEDYENYPVEEMKGAIPYCVMIKQAIIKDKGVKCRLEHHKCDGATTAFALENSTERIESGQEYFSYNLYKILFLL